MRWDWGGAHTGGECLSLWGARCALRPGEFAPESSSEEHSLQSPFLECPRLLPPVHSTLSRGVGPGVCRAGKQQGSWTCGNPGPSRGARRPSGDFCAFPGCLGRGHSVGWCPSRPTVCGTGALLGRHAWVALCEQQRVCCLRALLRHTPCALELTSGVSDQLAFQLPVASQKRSGKPAPGSAFRIRLSRPCHLKVGDFP